jgi:hypothetical protein
MSTPTYPYKRPGIYISETLLPLPTAAVAPGTAIGAFVGTHNSGPTIAKLVSSWAQFVSLYGGFGTGNDVLPYQVYQYFANGGDQAYILRAVASDAVAASLTVNNVPTNAASTQTPTPPGSAPTGSGSAPTLPVTVLALTSVTSPIINPEQTAIGVTFTATGSSGTVDAFKVVLTPPGSSPVSQTVWVPFVTGANGVVFTGLTPGTAYTVNVTPYKGTVAGPGMTTPGTFSTLAAYTPVPALTIRAKGLGAFGNLLYIDLVQSWTTGRFHLFVKVGSDASGALVESWQDVSLNPTDPRYAIAMINSSVGGSAYITLTNMLPPGSTSPGTGNTPDASWFPVLGNGTPLTAGSDGVAAVNLATSLTNGFAAIEDVLLLNLCGQFSASGSIPAQSVISAALAWIVARGAGFLVLDAPATPYPSDSAAATTAYTALLPAATVTGSYSPVTSYAAMYGPWIQVSDPAGTSVTATKILPPGGAMMGLFAQADSRVGPNQAPAGVNYPLVGAVGVEHLFTSDQLDTLNTAGMNVIRPVPQAGYCPMGVRTLKPGMPDRYIPIRRMLTYLENLLSQATRFAVFAPNGPLLWQTVSSVVQALLNAALMSGQLAGTTADSAYFVVCDSTNNTPQTVGNGEIHITVGVALQNPAEYVVLQISQYQGGVSTSVSGV